MTATEDEPEMREAVSSPDASFAGGTPPAKPHVWFTNSLALLLLLTVAARFFDIHADPPYGIVSTSGAFLTDEGWYSKSAQLHSRFGEWTSATDLVWYSHNILFTLLQSVAFDLFGISLTVARLISVASFVVALGSFYLICRTTQPPVIALVAAMLVSMTLQNLAYSRLALVEPMGVGFSLAALCCWVRLRHSVIGAVLAILLAGCAFLVKVAFVYTLIAVTMLLIADFVVLLRQGRRGRAIAHLSVALIGAIGVYAVHRAVVEWSAIDGATFEEWHVTGRAQSIDFLAVAYREIKMLYKVTYATGAPTLTCSLVFGLLFLAIKRWFRLDLPWSRGTVALMLWGLGGCAFFGLFEYQPPRYFYFALFPLVYATVMVTRRVAGDRHWRLAALFLLFLHIAVQIPGYFSWLRRDDLHSGDDTAQLVVRAIAEDVADDETVIVMGGLSSYISFYDDRIRPIDFRPGDQLEARLKRWRPRFLVCYYSRVQQLDEFAPGVVAKTEELAKFRVLDNYYWNEDHVLVRLTYAD